MAYIIRQATPIDAPAINQLCVESYAEFESVVGTENWLRMRETLTTAADLSRLGELLVAKDASDVLGVVLYIPPGRSDGQTIPQEWATIRMLAVAPASRGRGVGRRLTQACIDRARSDGAEIIGLTTSAMMKVAEPMYERMGFKKDTALGIRYGVQQARYKLVLNEAG